ncbi:MFS transporter [Pseudoxanthomonas sp.]|uniref:MFS transporter n=1 Tax=Pseudoxanthomonas sp. TaxID=1871049 RepID=UPI002633FA78|nr:MFS transporter [Pseudoxanthomonas sp.]WDS37008.1 MAG: MFS transporter [Pseudoxanthomonas sp.]
MRTSWRHLALINAVSFLAQTVQIGTVPPALALRLEAAGASPTSIGCVAAAPWVAILIFGRGVPAVLNRAGFVTSTLAGLALSALPLFGMASVADPLALFGLNFISGLGLILRWIACDTWITAVAPAEIRGRAIGMHETFMGCGIAAGPIVLAVSRVPLLVCAALLAISALLLLALWRADVRIRTEVSAMPAHAARGGGLRMLMAAGALAGLAETSAISFLPLMAQQANWALGAAAVLFGFGLGGTLLQVPVGWLADGYGDRIAQRLIGSVVLGGAVAIPFCTAHAGLLAVVLFLWGGAVGGANTLAVIEAGKRAGMHQVSPAMTAIALAYTVGSIVGPVLVGASQALLPMFGLAGVVALAAGGFLLMEARRPG